MRLLLVLSAILDFGLAYPSLGSEHCENAKAPSKRLIEFGWDCPTPAFLHKYINLMQERPFDGLVFRLRGKDRIVDPERSGLPALTTEAGVIDLQGGSRALIPIPFHETDFEEEYRLLSELEWGRFTENFVLMYAATDQDWFNDEHWETIQNNVRLVARAGRIAKCAGVLFDPEPYGPNPWDYKKTAHHDNATFEDYEHMVRRRGAQFIRAIESELPDVQMLTLIMLSALRDMTLSMTDQEQKALLADDKYGLLPAFLEGMLDGATPEARIIDGNEGSYYYKEREEYFEAYHYIRERARCLVDPALRGKYEQTVRTGHALYLDEYLGRRPGGARRHASYMTDAERLQWLEHNTFWALYCTDRYVWCYSERIVWWDFGQVSNEELHEMAMSWPEHGPIPAGCEESLRSAEKSQAEGRWPAIDLTPVMKRVESNRRLY